MGYFLDLTRQSNSIQATIISVGLKQYIAILNIFATDMGAVSPFLNIFYVQFQNTY